MRGGWGSDVWNKQLGRRYIISTVRAEVGGVVRWETALFLYKNLFSRPRLLTVHPVSEEAARSVHKWLTEYAETSWLALERPEFFGAELRSRGLWDLTEEGQAATMVRLICERCGLEYDFNTLTETQGGPYLCHRCRPEEESSPHTAS